MPETGSQKPPRKLRLRYPASCVAGGIALSKGAEAVWDPTGKTVTCLACSPRFDADDVSGPGLASRLPSSIGAAGEDWVEKRGSADECSGQVRLDGDFARKPAIGLRPSSWRGREAGRQRLAFTLGERVLDRLPKRRGVDRLGLCDQENVDEVFGPCARPRRGAVGAGVGVDLLCEVLRERRAGSRTGSMPAKESRWDVSTVSGVQAVDVVKPMSSVNCSKVRPAAEL